MARTGMTLKEFEQLVKLAKKAGILKLKMDGVEIEFDPESLHKKPRNKSTPEVPQSSPYTDEQTLMWSTQGNLDG